MPSLTVLFWNLNGKPLEGRVARIARAQAVDVAVLAECATKPESMAAALNSLGGSPYQAAPETAGGLVVLTRTRVAGWRLLVREPREHWVIYRVTLPPIPSFLLAGAHLPSKLWAGPAEQNLAARSLARDIGQFERQNRHRRTVVVGDLNMNPFEEGVAGAGGHLHAVMDRTVAEQESRQVQWQDYPLFYNPMWGLLGDRTAGPPGTYSAGPTGVVSYFWNTFDQVLLRPELAGALTDLRVLDTDGVESLLKSNGRPDEVNGSDHLPLLFRLDW